MPTTHTTNPMEITRGEHCKRAQLMPATNKFAIAIKAPVIAAQQFRRLFGVMMRIECTHEYVKFFGLRTSDVVDRKLGSVFVNSELHMPGLHSQTSVGTSAQPVYMSFCSEHTACDV